jgi:hypothetical protein
MAQADNGVAPAAATEAPARPPPNDEFMRSFGVGRLFQVWVPVC